jgi:hypothetical protein
MTAGGSSDEQQVLVVSVVEQEVAGELEERERGRGPGVELEQGEESECTEEAKEANEKQ